jgi:hypothetical protein
MSATGSTFEDCLPLTRLYAQFDAIAEGVVHGDSTAAHRAVLYRLTSNQRTAEALGWTVCTLERQGGSGRLLLRGVPSGGLAREIVPDWIPRPPEATEPEWIARVQRSPSDRKHERYRHLEVLIRERVLAASPAMTATPSSDWPDVWLRRHTSTRSLPPPSSRRPGPWPHHPAERPRPNRVGSTTAARKR